MCGSTLARSQLTVGAGEALAGDRQSKLCGVLVRVNRLCRATVAAFCQGPAPQPPVRQVQRNQSPEAEGVIAVIELVGRPDELVGQPLMSAAPVSERVAIHVHARLGIGQPTGVVLDQRQHRRGLTLYCSPMAATRSPPDEVLAVKIAFVVLQPARLLTDESPASKADLRRAVDEQ